MTDRPSAALTWQDLQHQLPDFDLCDIGLMISENAPIYLNLLRQFLEDYREEGVNIVYLLGTDNRHEAQRLLHKLKGVAGNLGAKALHLVSEQLDAQLKKGFYGEHEYNAWQTRFIRTLEDVGKLLERHAGVAHGGRNAHADLAFNAMLKELEDALARNAFVNPYLLESMQPHVQPPEMELYGRLVKFITQRDYPKARSTLKTLIYVVNAVDHHRPAPPEATGDRIPAES